MSILISTLNKILDDVLETVLVADSNWILINGLWRDEGDWIDTELWKDS